MEGDLVLKERKVYVPKDEELRKEIIQLYHNIPVVEYKGKWKTIELVTVICKSIHPEITSPW